MCRIYSSTDPHRYESVTRSVRLNGFVTSVRLEHEFWNTLDHMAEEQGLSVSQFIAQLHDEVEDERGEVRNLTSLLRVACIVYLTRDDAARSTKKTHHAARPRPGVLAGTAAKPV